MRPGGSAAAVEVQDIADYVPPLIAFNIDYGHCAQFGGDGGRLRFVADQHLLDAGERRDHLGPVVGPERRRPGFGFAVDQDQEIAVGGPGSCEPLAMLGGQHVEPAASAPPCGAASRLLRGLNDLRARIQVQLSMIAALERIPPLAAP